MGIRGWYWLALLANGGAMHGLGPQGLLGVFEANRDALRRFLAARGARDAVEDLLQELWLKLERGSEGPIGNPKAYLFRAAENLMRDRHRAERQARLREQEWTDATGPAERRVSDAPSGERILIAREDLAAVQVLLRSFPLRAQEAFRLHRLDGMPQKEVAERLAVSLSTIEKDLRDIYRALLAARGGAHAV